MTYYESAKGAKITKKRAIQELQSHGIENNSEGFSLFLKELGDKPEYKAQKVLDWLGY